MGVALGEEREERTDLVESFRSRPDPGPTKFIDAAARATWEGDGIGGV